jgi:DNA-binding protein HU-beta
VNKNDLCLEVAKKTGMSKADVSKAVDATLDAITDALKNNDDVRLVGFGTYSVTERSASEGRNPRTGEAIKIPASKRAKFKPGKGLNDALN